MYVNVCLQLQVACLSEKCMFESIRILKKYKVYMNQSSMYVCMCVCMYVCMYVLAYIQMLVDI